MNFRRGGFWMVGIWCAAALGACVGASSEVGSMDGGEGGLGDENQCEAGATKPAGDGCNTCTCDDEGNWGCTELTCGQCSDGAMRAAVDGCNQCICTGGEWACTLRDCSVCTVGQMRQDDCGSCWCADNGDGPTWNCTANLCPVECEAGETKPADDGCNTCTCTMQGTWSCTDTACPACMPGETMPASDGCNTCMCYDGMWGCTMALCNEPLVCDDGMADCNGDRADACETNIQSAVDNCGACGNLCNFAGALGACENGECAVGECMAGYADCNGVIEDGCEAPVGAGGCTARCDVSTMVEPVPAGENCQCPTGTVCLRGSLEDEDPDSEYCFPIPEGCDGGLGRCDCMADCFCPAKEDTYCYDEMASGGVFIVNCPGYPTL